MPNPVQNKMTSPSLLLGDLAGTPVELRCHTGAFALTGERDEDSRTWCNKAGEIDWTISFPAKQSFGPDGFWDLTVPLDGTDVPFRFLPNDNKPVSAINKLALGTVTVMAPEVFVDSDFEKKRTEFAVEWAVVEVTFHDTDPNA